jgi:hypothetical protein
MNPTDAGTTQITIVDLFGVRGCNSDHDRVSFRSQGGVRGWRKLWPRRNGLPHRDRHLVRVLDKNSPRKRIEKRIRREIAVGIRIELG